MQNQTNQTKTDILKNSLRAVCGLVLYGLGVYLTIQASIGTAPWDTLSLGIAGLTGLSFGTVAVAISFIVLFADILLREKIGIGMFLDAVIVGKTVDLLNFLDLVKPAKSFAGGLPLMVLGMVISGIAQAVYMKAALGCGPRDSLLVGVSRHLPRLPIGAVSIGIQACVALLGWLLGGPIGVGTLLYVLLQGPIMQMDFRLLHFDAKAVRHQDLFESLRILSGKTE